MKTGLFAIIALAVLVGTIFQIGKAKNMFGDTFQIYGTFKSVGGLQVGNNVRFAGVNVGTVQAIQIVSDTLARVDIILESKVRPFLKSNAIASIGSDGLMGDKLIMISAAAPIADLIKPGAKINTLNPTDMSELVAKMERIADNAEVITDGLAAISTHISQGKGSLGRLLYSDKLVNNLEGTVSSMKEGTQGFSDNMKALKGNVLLRGYYKRKDRKEQKRKEEAREQQAESKGSKKNK